MDLWLSNFGHDGSQMNVSTSTFWLESMTECPSLIDTYENVCIKIRGLPYNVGQRDMLEFSDFRHFNILSNNIPIVVATMNCSNGELFMKFISSNEAYWGMAHHMHVVGSHCL